MFLLLTDKYISNNIKKQQMLVFNIWHDKIDFKCQGGIIYEYAFLQVSFNIFLWMGVYFIELLKCNESAGLSQQKCMDKI